MNNVLVIGYDTRRKRTAEPVVLYCGKDADAARGVHYNPRRGIVKTELIRNPEGRQRVHDPEREGAPVEEVSVKVEVEVLDLPMVKGLFALALEGLEEANKRLVAAGLEPLTVVLPGELADLDEEDLAELKELRVTEELAKQMKALGEKLEEVSGRAIAAEGVVSSQAVELKELQVKFDIARVEAEKVKVLEAERAELKVKVETLAQDLAIADAEKVRLIAELEGKNPVTLEEKKEAAPAGPALELTDVEKEKAPGGRKK